MKYFNVWQESELSFTAKGVYCLLRQFANNVTLKCWPSVGKMCELAGLSKPTLRKALKDLEKNQCLLIMHTVNDRGVICANQYQLLCPDERSGPGSGGCTITPDGKKFTPDGKGITVDGKQLTLEGKNFTPNLSKRTITNNLSNEGNGSCKNKIPRAFASLGIDPAEFTGLAGREATE